MALNRTSSSTFADNVMFERNAEIPSQEGVKMKKFRSCASELAGSLHRIEECCRAGEGKSEMMLGLIAEEVKKSQELAEVLNSFADTVKELAVPNQVVVKEIAGFGSSAQHLPTFYTSATGTVEVVPAPEFRSAEAFSPGSLSVAVTNSALKMVKSPKKGKRQRDRKSKKPQVPLQIVKTEDDGKIPDDGYSWRKYGSKNIKTAIYKKAYYRCNAPCSKNKNRKCLAKKTVQQANNDPTVLHLAYDAPHSCTVASEMQDCPSEDAQGGAGNLNLAEQMLSSDAGLVSQAQTAEWVLMNQFSVLRTSSGNFSAVSEEEILGGTDHDPLASLTKGCRMVNGDSLELRELSDLPSINDMMGSGLEDWTTGLETDSQESKALQCERQYVDPDSLQDIIEEKLLMERILHRELQEPDSYFRNRIGDIHNWHSYGS